MDALCEQKEVSQSRDFRRGVMLLMADALTDHEAAAFEPRVHAEQPQDSANRRKVRKDRRVEPMRFWGMDSSRRAVIIGAGVAGPALGLALHHVGIHAVVCESSTAARDDEGGFLNIAPNGIAALGVLGVERVMEGLGFRNDRLIFHNEGGRVIAEAPVGAVTASRGAFSRTLRDAAMSAGVGFEFGKVLVSVESARDGVIARFADGSMVEASCAIGADGIHSRTRDSVCPEAPRPTYTGIINLGGMVRTDLSSTDTAMHMVFGRRGFFGYAVRPSGETYWFSNFARAEEPAPGSLKRISGRIWRQSLIDLHRDDPPDVRRILDAVDDQIGCYAIYDIPSLPRWHRDRLCLIGDAAHAIGPHVGQGASLALEDAVVLAKCLRDQPQIPAAFAAFEHARRDRVERVVRQARRTGSQKAPAGWVGRKIRDLVLPIFLRKSAQAAQALYAYPLNWD
jgi:FAD-dependent urate hydroxylase